ncbi:hypothetical protein EI94DRAFT_1699658 [Lactarius quietus]|nr:hypothetical protein EI94DRAFT_1699658 [Lactarius quietus]
MPKEGSTRKVCEKPAPYFHKTKPVTKKDAPKTSVKPSVTQNHEKNLTLANWLVVFKFIDKHPRIPQTQVVNHFKTCKDDALVLHMEEEKDMGKGLANTYTPPLVDVAPPEVWGGGCMCCTMPDLRLASGKPTNFWVPLRGNLKGRTPCLTTCSLE